MEIKRNEIVEKRVVESYVAADGTEFDSQDECREYEKTHVCAIKARLHEMALAEDTECNMYDGSGTDETLVYVVIPKNEEELRFVRQALSINHSKNAEKVSGKDIGRVLLIGFTYGDEYVYVTKLDDLVSKITGGKWVAVEKGE